MELIPNLIREQGFFLALLEDTAGAALKSWLWLSAPTDKKKLAPAPQHGLLGICIYWIPLGP